ncbi:ABC transporter ATP-binding protein [Nocardioides humi]|uniref:ABC transporter ATP-binding protein n=1 Tax=Nocardioides humi TaxID=449461 RepID=A0ABN2AVN7_9ACTN|nr:ABC transporter ATP-binding protein [Nocardioides humi]
MAEPAPVPESAEGRLRADGLAVRYGDRVVIEDLDVVIPDGRMTVVVGPNACGKSTLLRALARLVPAAAGTLTLDDRPLADYGAKELARRLGLLPQSPTAPDGLTVADLVARGRYPHQSLLRQWSPADRAAVDAAMAAADVTDLADRGVGELSGGQRQRVWLAMVLAQETGLLLLDEPTTYLDIAHQVEVLELARRLSVEGRTVVTVLHELNLAFRYADHLVVMSRGAIVAQGDPTRIVTPELIESVYDLPCRIIPDPLTGTPLVIPAVMTTRELR